MGYLGCLFFAYTFMLLVVRYNPLKKKNMSKNSKFIILVMYILFLALDLLLK